MYGIFIYFYAITVNVSYGFLYSEESFTWVLGFYNAIMKFLFYFLNAKQMQKSKYAKVEIIYAMRKSKYG